MNALAPPTTADLIQRYRALRDHVKLRETQFEEEMKPYKQGMEAIGGVLNQQMLDDGVMSIRTDQGTAYKSTTLSVRAADKDAFMRHVIGEEAWALLEVRPAKDAVNEFIEANNAPPPGVDVTYVTKVNIRK